ncbi:MAG: 4-hydroxythreonine-4-phosphate dehydrogenase PdxA [Rickettsiales bacterium]
MITNTGPIAVTMGEPSGIGGEIAIKAWQQRELLNLPPFFLIDAPQRVKGIAGRLEWDVAVQPIDRPEDASGCFVTHLPVLPLELPVPAIPGQPRSENGAAVISSIQQAVELTLAGRAAAVVTNPIQKKTLYDAGFEYPGHTEFIAKLCRTGNPPIMMLACSELRVVPVTIHQSLAEALKSLRTETIIETALQTGAALASDFGIERPDLAVAALNPHAGEDGSMGREEIDIIRPAIEELKRLGHSVTGPAPADTLFHERARKTYDAAICMYHDQALIPLKTIDFRSGVNITLGLPIVRTSPDHGTALEIAGTGVADEASFVAALKSASGITMHRQRNPS